MEKIQKNATFFKKTLDNLIFCVIILKCIIIAFTLGDFCPFLTPLL